MIEINWDEYICCDKEWKRIIVHYSNSINNNNFIFEIIVHRFGYNDYYFYYETLCNISLKEKEEIEQYLIQYFKDRW